ncbi:MAG TPA: HD domain-containing protein [Thermoanaerobaculia bacterium]|nr:HD domain-containing protein [Thermoanaerobaculia bacterium]
MPRLQRNVQIRSWEAGDSVEGFALLTKKELRQDRNGKSYLDMELADSSGSIVAKIWADSPALNGQFEAHRFIAFRGSVKSYRDQLQLSIDNCREANDEDRRFGFDEALLIPSTAEDIDDLWSRLSTLLEVEVERPVLRRLAAETLAVCGKELREHPAAKSIHHAYRGGLLEHVVSMAELALLVSRHYRDLDRDLLLLGVLFHDLGKLRELGAMPANDYTLEGRLIGHVVLGRDLLRERCAAIEGFPADLELLLGHLVLSHQGKKEFSSPVEPMTPEAVALHFLDDLDAKLNQLRTARAESPGMLYHRGLARFVYLAPTPAPERDDLAAGEPLEPPDSPPSQAQLELPESPHSPTAASPAAAPAVPAEPTVPAPPVVPASPVPPAEPAAPAQPLDGDGVPIGPAPHHLIR